MEILRKLRKLRILRMKKEGKKRERGKEGLFLVFCILTFPPESLGGEDFLGEFPKTQKIIPLFLFFPLFKNNIYNKRINGKEYTNKPLKKNWD